MPELRFATRWRNFASAIALAVLCIGCKPARPATIEPASVGVPKDSSDQEQGVLSWVREAMVRSGIPGDDRIRLVRSGARWVADFRDLPIWTLPEDGGDFLVPRVYPDSIRLEGASLCDELPGGVGSWLDRVQPDWRRSQKCSGEDQRKALEKWLEEVRGELVLVHQTQDGQGNVSGLELSCRTGKSEFPLGRLLPLRHLKSLEIAGCRLGTRQILLKHLPVDRLVVRDSKDRRLNVRGIQSLDTLRVEGGAISWLDVPVSCPDGGEECADAEKIFPHHLHLSGIPLCDPDLDSAFGLIGAVRDSMRCREYPKDLAVQAETVVKEFMLQTSDDADFEPNSRAASLPRFRKAYQIPKSRRWEGVEPRKSGCFQWDAYQMDSVSIGVDWIFKPALGMLFLGQGSKPVKSLPRIGTDRSDLAKSLPDALLSTTDFLVYGDPKGDVDLILHFDPAESLDAIWLPQGCWTESWGTRYSRVHPVTNRYIEEGE